MNYTELLNKIIKESGLKNIEIIEKLKEKGVSITPNYLSVLRNNTAKIPSDEVSEAIAIVCNAPKELLIIQSELDKSSGALKSYIDFTLQTIKDSAKSMINILPEEFKAEAKKKLEEQIDAEIICDIVEHPEHYRSTSINLTEVIGNYKQKYAIVPMGIGDIKIVEKEEVTP